MNSNLVMAAEGEPRKVAHGFEEARKYLESGESRFSRFLENSELSALNRGAGEWVSVSTELYEVVHEAYTFAGETGGLFDPSVLGALENAGYDRSMDEIRALGSNLSGTHNTHGHGGFLATQFDPSSIAIRLPSGTRVDLGGIAKGWLAERAARVLAEYTSACAISAGGDLFAVGLPAGQSAWDVALEDPRDERESLALLRVGPGAVATSSVTKRRWHQDGRTMHHLIDPRTGLPAETVWLSVTVIAPHATTAEVFAKCLLIAGPGEAEKLAARRNDTAFIAADGEANLWGSSNAREFLNVGFEYA